MNDTAFETLFEQVQKLSTAQRLRMLELLAATLQTDFVQQTDWHTALKATYGILADDPIERRQQLPMEEREPIEWNYHPPSGECGRKITCPVYRVSGSAKPI